MIKMLENSQNLTRYSQEADTCYGRETGDFIDDFFGQFQDSFFFTFVLQFLMVLLMYLNVGKGKYWKLLFYASVAGLLGSFLENGTVAYICRSNGKNDVYKYVYPFLIDELFWIPNEYAIPLLNLIKMKAFSEGKIGGLTKYTIAFLSLPFIFFRFCIGYYRMTLGIKQSPEIRAYHGYAFAVMAVADIICTVVLLYLIKVNNSKIAISGSNINEFVKHSSYTILITVDIVCALLSICNILSNVGPLKDTLSDKLFTPFHCLKCSAILILAIDAFIFKYGANVSSNNESTSNRFYGNNESSNTYGNNLNASTNSNYRSKLTNFNTEMNSSSKSKNKVVSISSPYSFDKSPTITNSKSIIKNYSSNNKSSITNDSYDRTVYSGHSFGFLNQQNQ